MNSFALCIHQTNINLKNFSYSNLKAVGMLLRHVNSQRTEVAYKPRSFLWKLLFANYPFFTSQDWPHEHAVSRDTCVINFSELDQFSFHHCPLQKGLFFFPLPTTASNFAEGVAGYIQSQEPSDIKRGTAHRQCFPCRARVCVPAVTWAGQDRQTAQWVSAILMSPAVGDPAEGTLSLEGPCKERS